MRTILIADANETFIKELSLFAKGRGYQIIEATNGPDALKRLKDTLPHLALIDIMLPVMHGIEVLKIIRSLHPELSVIITSYQTMIQNYRAAIEAGACYFLAKPFTFDALFSLFDRFFADGSLTPLPFTPAQKELSSDSYMPEAKKVTSYLRFWGTRGSNPVSGPEFLRFGGNTSSLEIHCDGHSIVIDAGTGVRGLGEKILESGQEDVQLIISHTHWDHIAGFPFFSPIYRKQGNLTIWSPVGYEKSTKELFTEMLAYAYFPVRLEEMNSQIVFKEMRDHRPIHFGNLVIDSRFTIHPGPTLGFKIISPNKKIGYITDNEALMGFTGHPNEISISDPIVEPYLQMINFLSDCDIIIHEAQYFPIEYTRKIGWGHSSITNATALMKLCGCKEWIITHHDPKHTDDILEEKLRLHEDILRECSLSTRVQMAHDGMIIPL